MQCGPQCSCAKWGDTLWCPLINLSEIWACTLIDSILTGFCVKNARCRFCQIALILYLGSDYPASRVSSIFLDQPGREREEERSLPLPDWSRKIEETSAHRVGSALFFRHFNHGHTVIGNKVHTRGSTRLKVLGGQIGKSGCLNTELVSMQNLFIRFPMRFV